MLSDPSTRHPLVRYIVRGPLLALTFTYTETTMTKVLRVARSTVSITPEKYASLRGLAIDDWRDAARIFAAASAGIRARVGLPRRRVVAPWDAPPLGAPLVHAIVEA